MRSLRQAISAWKEYLRRLVLRLLNNAVSRLQNPDEVAFRQAFETHSYNACLRLAIDLGIFRTILAHGGKGVTAEQLVPRGDADVQLIVRIMRVVTAIGYASEVAEKTYGPTPLTESIAKPTIEAAFLHSSEHAAVVSSRLGDYFKATGYHNPTNGKDGPFQFAVGTKLPFFEFIHNDPRKLKNFNTFQAGNRSTRKSWLEWFPIQRVLLNDFSKSSNPKTALLVDMGGGTGRDILAFLHKYPQSSGSLVLQDLPRTIEGLSDMDKGVTAMAHDLFEPQPILGAKAYYTHFLLHDFPDDKCQIMLRRAASAMTPGYSRLLLNETILPNTGCPAFYAAADITMMSVLAGMNRSESQWKELLESSGLQLVKFWYSNDASNREGIIEAVRAPPTP